MLFEEIVLLISICRENALRVGGGFWYNFYSNLISLSYYVTKCFKMEKLENKNNMTVVHLAFGASKPVAPFTERQLTQNKVLDPSSSLRADRYPIPTSFEYRYNPRERDYA